MPLHPPHANVRKMFPLSEEPSHDRRLSVVVHRVAVLRLRSPSRHSFRNRFGRFRIRSLSDRSRGGTVRGARHARTGSSPSSCPHTRRGTTELRSLSRSCPESLSGPAASNWGVVPVLLRGGQTLTSHLTVRPIDDIFHRPDRHTMYRRFLSGPKPIRNHCTPLSFVLVAQGKRLSLPVRFKPFPTRRAQIIVGVILATTDVRPTRCMALSIRPTCIGRGTNPASTRRHPLGPKPQAKWRRTSEYATDVHGAVTGDTSCRIRPQACRPGVGMPVGRGCAGT